MKYIKKITLLVLILAPLHFAFCPLPLQAGTVFDTPMPTNPPVINTSTFSTNIDLEIITGLRARQYKFSFQRDNKTVGAGLELFVLDEFPCFSQNEDARIWIAPGAGIDKSANIQLTCVYAPTRVQFAWRNAKKGASKGITQGLLECALKDDSTNITIDLAKCEKTKEWKDIR
ncbi:MAG: hypothetical protein LBJ18_01835 [Rickettsiales bacterium]|jgi:hypothetical protein|nr:hypothetical protein [Rickettsiales bacterium]